MSGGGGITNYSTDKPTYGYTTSTTEFDDALIQRGIVTTEQVMLAKGASMEDAIQLAQEKKNGNGGKGGNLQQQPEQQEENQWNNDKEENDDDDDDDDEFFARYRQERLAQLKGEQNNNNNNKGNSSIKEIVRDEWMIHVNEASHKQWIVVALIDSSCRQYMLQEINQFVRQQQQQQGDDDDDEDDDQQQQQEQNSRVSFCVIQSTQAIENWPSERVPAIFAYRDGLKQYEWIASSNGIIPSPIQPLLQQWGII